MTRPALVVHVLSDSFSEAWPGMAADADLALRTTATPPVDVDPTHGVVLLAAGGAESELLKAAEALRASSEVAFAAVAAAADHRLAAALVRAGAEEVFVVPADLERLRSWLQGCAERLRSRADRTRFATGEAGKYAFDGILGASGSLAAVLERVARIIPHGNVTVLITGETGTGKELIARAIHYHGPRREGPFVDINCAALPEHLLESDLFGHEKGAFTDASATKPGLFEMAEGGSIFLDEIGHLALPLQGKLLRALQERRIRRVGGVRSIAVDVRVIAATHVNLLEAVRAGQFREDLFYRLNVVPIQLPPLRQRRDDILPLARHFLGRFAAEYGVPLPRLTAAAERALLDRAWPGNVRELRNVVERTVLLASGTEIEPVDFEFTTAADGSAPDAGAPRLLSEIIARAVRDALAEAEGNKSEAARRLGISRPRLMRLLDPEPTPGTEEDGDA
ncbi:MAG: sigma-54 dependent transcriptional regulator [Gemmatimonadales bacterium]|nr:sigma-54-dependent Fis family transcriptional regulator [Gemmatimonadota bacterium]MCL4212977.1 sigma-54 dependent transcriptional regulator [Gemmatimonadales bacterium]